MISCTSTTESDAIKSQVVIFHAKLSNNYYDRNNYQTIDIKNISGLGTIFAEPLPQFEYFTLGDTTFYGQDFYKYSTYSPGHLEFGEFPLYNDARVFNNLSTLNFRVKTSLGELSGTVNLPDTITTLTLSVTDTLNINEPLTVSWESGFADFYAIFGYYSWRDVNGINQRTSMYVFTSNKSYTYPASTFSDNGKIEYLYVIPMNGPLPAVGTIGNLKGDGSGYLYYQVKAFNYNRMPLIVGAGESTNSLTKSVFIEKTPQDIESGIFNEIRKRILSIE